MADAATYYWDGTNTVANNQVNGGTGAWNAANTNWTNADGSVNNAWVAGSDAVFSATAGTVTLGSGASVGNLVFDVTGYLLTGNTITLSNGSVIDTGSGTATINSTLSGAAVSVIKNGSGMLIVGGNNTGFTGSFSINEGMVVANHASNGKVTGATTINVGDGSGAAGSAVWQFGQNNTAPFSNSTSMNIASDGVVDLNGKSLGGGTNMASFTANFSGGGRIVGSGTSSTGGGSFSLASNNSTGSTTLTLAGSGTYSAAGGNINVVSAGSSLSGSGVGGAATLTLNNGAAIDTQGGNIMLLSGNNGGSTVSGNTVLSSNGGGSINTGTGALIFATGSNNLGSATSTIFRTGTAGDSSVLSIAGNIFIGLPGGGASQSNRQLILAATGISNPAADNLVISAVIADGAGNSGNGLTKMGSHSVALSGSNTYTGQTAINQGTLYAIDGVGLPTNSNLSLGGGIFESSGVASRSLGTGNNQLNWSSGGFSARGGTLTVAVGGTAAPAALTVGSTANFVANQMTFGSSLSDAATVVLNDINLNGITTTFTIFDNASSSADYTELRGVISGSSGQLLKSSNGGGLLYLSNNANSTATATTRIGGGTLRVTANAASLLGGNLNYNATGTNVAVVETSGTFSRSLGTGTNTVQWSAASSGGFAAYGGDLYVQLNGGAGTLTIGSTANFVGTAGSLQFGSSMADSTVHFENGLNLGTSGNTAVINVQRGVSAANPEVNFTGTVSGAANLQKTGSGRMVLSSVNSYTGTTTVSAGTLIVSGAGSINTSNRVVVDGSGAVFRYDSSTALTQSVSYGAGGGTFAYNSAAKYTGGPLTAGTGAVVSGTGVLGEVTVASGGVLSPGNSPGLLVSDTQTWEGGGSYLWEINNAGGSEGMNWDLVSISAGNDLDITATTSSKFTISIYGLTAGNESGVVPGFDNTQNYVWTIATVGIGGSITGFDPAAFTLDSSAFANNNNLAGGMFSIATNGNDLNLVFTSAIPEPSTYVLILCGLAGLVFFRRGRCRR